MVTDLPRSMRMPKSKNRPELPPPQISSDDLPLSECETSGIHFHIEFVDVPDAKKRYERLIEHLGDWLLAVWESEEAAETRRRGSQTVQPGA
jgi:hypothetical protein